MGTITDGLIAWYPLDDTAEIGKDISGNSYIQLPEQLLAGVDDKIGITVSAWVCEDVAASVWERIFDFGDGQDDRYKLLEQYEPEEVKRIEDGIVFSTGSYAVLIICDDPGAVRVAFEDAVSGK